MTWKINFTQHTRNFDEPIWATHVNTCYRQMWRNFDCQLILTHVKRSADERRIASKHRVYAYVLLFIILYIEQSNMPTRAMTVASNSIHYIAHLVWWSHSCSHFYRNPIVVADWMLDMVSIELAAMVRIHLLANVPIRSLGRNLHRNWYDLLEVLIVSRLCSLQIEYNTGKRRK